MLECGEEKDKLRDALAGKGIVVDCGDKIDEISRLQNNLKRTEGNIK